MELSLRRDLKIPFIAGNSVSQTLSATQIQNLLILSAAIVAFFLKLIIAYNTFGTNDVAAFYMFAHSLNEHGLEWTYRNGVIFFSNFPIFNHPPLTAYYLQLIERLSQLESLRSIGVTFPFLLRLPGIVSDFVVVIVLMRASQANPQLRIPRWGLVLFALSPVSLMVSGFHGNTDSIVVMFLVLAATMCLHDRPILCGVFLALSCQIKVISMLVVPIIFFYWLAHKSAMRFAIPFVLVCATTWAKPLIKFPSLFFKNVFSYNSYWGSWGITYWLRLTRWPPFQSIGPFHQSGVAIAVGLLLKIIIVAAVLAIAWRRRRLSGLSLVHSIAYAWIIFFVFAPGVCPQYMVWLSPFILILSPTFYGWLTTASTIFLFVFYNSIAGGLPWFIAISRINLKAVWVPWSLLTWATLLIGMISFWKNSAAADFVLRLLGLEISRSKET